MNDDDEVTADDPGAGTELVEERFHGMSAQIDALTELIGSITAKLTALRGRIETLESGAPDETDPEDDTHDRPGRWVFRTPPAAAEDRTHRVDDHTPLWTVRNFVGWYNVTFVGVPGGPDKPIPPCWEDHLGLPDEIAALAYSWRRANIGPTANVRDAQQWLQQTRPGFCSRMTEWVHPHCLSGRHREVGVPGRPSRFTDAGSAEHSRAHDHVESTTP